MWEVLSHVRDPSRGAVLTNGGVDYQLTEMVKADPFGVGGTINVGDKVVAGSIEIRPVFKDDAEKDAKSREEFIDLLGGDEASPAV